MQTYQLLTCITHVAVCLFLADGSHVRIDTFVRTIEGICVLHDIQRPLPGNKLTFLIPNLILFELSLCVSNFV